MEKIRLSADDGKGGTGVLSEDNTEVDTGTSTQLHIEKTLYQPGEPIHIDIRSTGSSSLAIVSVTKDDQLLDSFTVRLVKGRASITLPWRKEFVHEITIAASTTYSGDNEDSDSDSPNGAAQAVMFPMKDDLRLTVKAERTEFRPGEDASADVSVRMPDGSPAAAAVGVAIVDEAVAERASTDEETRGRHFGWWAYSNDSLGGLSLHDLEDLDTSRPFPKDLDLLAEALLSANAPYLRSSFNTHGELDSVFPTGSQFNPISVRLNDLYRISYHYPRDIETLRRDLAGAGIDLDSMRDPWGTPYRVQFKIDGWYGGWYKKTIFLSAGPDKKFGTADDLVAYTIQRKFFQQAADVIGQKLNKLPSFPQTEQAAREFLAQNIDPALLVDPWGVPYRMKFDISGSNAALEFTSAGPDRRFDTRDDERVGSFNGSYFKELREKIDTALYRAATFPRTNEELKVLLQAAGLYPLEDPWQHELVARFGEKANYSDVLRFYDQAKWGNPLETRIERIPVTQKILTIDLVSRGPDGKLDTPDDFVMAGFTRTVTIEPEPAPAAMKAKTTPDAPGTGSIAGAVFDPMHEAMPNVVIGAIPNNGGKSPLVIYETTTDLQGRYLLTGIPAGVYELRVDARGFQQAVLTEVPVKAGKAIHQDFQLRIGTVKDVVEITSTSPILQVENAMVGTTMPDRVKAQPKESHPAVLLSTPRLRQYFPETLYWNPMIETRHGRAHFSFKLADNITTWQMQVIGSTLDGKVATASADIRAFQPFFADHDPPRILTQGDRIDLPVIVRNYTEKAQNVSVVMKPETWFELKDGVSHDLNIASGASANAVFALRATAAITDGKQRVTAAGPTASDAIEKPVTVHPDGEETAKALNALLSNETVLDIEIPQDAIAGSTRAELKVYPNLMAHVIESIEAILKRPYGCGEQTISSTYPNLLALRFLKRAGHENNPIAAKAHRYLQAGIDRLMGYRDLETGGFTYWGHGKPDITLTAYAVQFLEDAKAYGNVDDDVLKSARGWLKKMQAPTGEWKMSNPYSGLNDQRTLYETAGIALSMARAKSDTISGALDYLKTRVGSFDEPYAIASYTLAAFEAGRDADARIALGQLRRLAQAEAGFAYWDLKSNTPFYGWGYAGRLETTALALRALLRANDPGDKPLIDSALLFLLRSKDRYGVWYSTQATVKVLDAIGDAMDRETQAAPAGPAEILVDGKTAAKIALPASNEFVGPITTDISQYLNNGPHRVSIHRAAGSATAQVQLAAAYYMPWREKQEPAASPLRFKVEFDKTAVKAGETVTCSISAERVGFRGYGMLLAEIGLPPGADVDRQSLEAAMDASGWALNHFDILPDRVVAYLWPYAGTTKFSFRFKPRFSMQAKAAPSEIYDYYNPDARVVQAPVEFSVGKR